jgi:hypothetical protein
MEIHNLLSIITKWNNSININSFHRLPLKGIEPVHCKHKEGKLNCYTKIFNFNITSVKYFIQGPYYI